MKTKMSITIDDELKQLFKAFAKSVWTNSSNLIQMMMSNALTTWEVRFKSNGYSFVVEDFSDNELGDLIKEWWKDYNKLTNLLKSRKWK